MDQYLPIFAIFVLGALFATVSLGASRLLGPHRPTSAKLAPYECGIVPNREPAQRFPVRFYLVAMIFIIFDIEIIFLYPWAVIYRQLDLFGLIEIVVFSVAVVVSLAYLLSNGALDWGPARRLAGMASPTRLRSSTSTIRRVPRPTIVPTAPELAFEPEGNGTSEDESKPETEPAPSRR
jgi:NADH-quinone oxidoreductase subunit A